MTPAIPPSTDKKTSAPDRFSQLLMKNMQPNANPDRMSIMIPIASDWRPGKAAEAYITDPQTPLDDQLCDLRWRGGQLTT